MIAAARLGPGARVIVVDGAGVPVATSDARAGRRRSRSPGDDPVGRSRARVDGRRHAVGERLGQRVSQPVELPVAARRALGDHPPAARGRRLRARAPHDARHADRRRCVALALALALGAFFATRLTRPLADARAPRRRDCRRPRDRRRRRSAAPARSACSRSRSTRWRSGSPSAPSSQRRSRAAIGSRRSA